jgi:radical SAM protein with 4Fe4S-binding SPASM domain
MDCADTTYNTTETFLQQFSQKALQQRVPLSGSFAITHRCNLRCAHCYLGSQKKQNQLRPQEMSTAKVLSVLDEITEAGCLYLLITGGEPLLRKDFPEIYTHAKENGLLVTVFTNGTMISENILDLFRELPPRTVEITVYGASEATYKKVSGIDGSFQRCMSGIQGLLDQDIPLKLKAIIMSHNRHEFLDIKKIADDLGVDFRFDADLFPTFDGDLTPIDLRIPPQEVIEIELAESGMVEEWHNYQQKYRMTTQNDSLYQCGAGQTSFHIDPFGNLLPCLMTLNYTYDLNTGSFLDGWENETPVIRERKASNGNGCMTCESRTLCGFCPAFFELENGSEEVKSNHLCTMGHLRFDAIKSLPMVSE